MSCSSDPDFLPLLSTIPGPRGPKGDAGVTPTAPAPRFSFTHTTSPFVMPAAGGAVTITVEDSSWMAVGQALFIETAGQFLVATVLSTTAVSVTAQENVPANAAAGTVIPTARKVAPGGITHVDPAVFDDFETRLNTLELSPGGIRTYYSSTAPAGAGLRVGDIWYETADVGATVIAQWRWDGSGWVKANAVLSLADFGTGIRPIRKVDTLPPGGGSVGDFVLLTTDNKLYRGTGSGWTRALATGDLVGQVDASTLLVDGTILAQHLGAQSVTAEKVGANQIITLAANIGEAVINTAHVDQISAGKISAGDIQAVNFGYSGRIFHTSYAARKFRSVDFGTSFGDGKVFAAGNCLSPGYSHATPVIGYCPGHGAWTSTGLTACPDTSGPGTAGRVRVQAQGRLIGYAGKILLYVQVNNATPGALAARTSDDGGHALIDATRILTGIEPTDLVKLFVAPADGNGVIESSVTCRFELDVTFFNW